MSSFQIDGLGSGLDTADIISKLMSVERVPLLRMQQEQAEITSTIPSLQDINSKLLSLKNAASDLKIKSYYQTHEANSSEEANVSVGDIGPDSILGNHTINSITRLATSSIATSNKEISGNMESSSLLSDAKMRTDVSNGTFTINGTSFFVDTKIDSLDDIIADINAQSGTTGVTASYDSATDKFKLANTNPGDTSTISLGATSDTSNFLTATAVLGSFQDTSSGKTVVDSSFHLGAVDKTTILNDANFAEAITDGNFKINGTTISINTAVDSLADVLGRINESGAGVTATYDQENDQLKITRDDTGEPLIKFEGGTSNFLDAVNLKGFESSGSISDTVPANATGIRDLNTLFAWDGTNNMDIDITGYKGTDQVTINRNDDLATAVGIINGVTANTGVVASYDEATGIFKLENDTLGETASITVADVSGNFAQMMRLDDATEDSSSGTTTLSSSNNIGTIRTADLMSDANFATPIVAGEIEITHGGVTSSFVYDPATDSTDDLLNAINTDPTLGITVSYSTTGDGFKITTDSGTSPDVSMSEIGAGNFLTAAKLDNFTPFQVAGENAEYELDGNTYYSNSNTIDDRLTDVVFTLEAVTTDPTTLNITANSSDAKENISDFVEKYNEVLTELHTLINDEEGVLYNDSGLKDIFNSIRRIPNEIVKGTGSSYTTLSSIGITTGSSATATSDDYFGLLEIDEDTLTAALNDDAKGVSNLFFFDPKGGANFTSGIGNSFEERLSPLTSATGTLNARTTLMTESMDNLLKRITDRESSLKLKEDNLKRTYVNLEVMMGQLSRQGEWLSQQLSGLGSFGG